MRLFLAALVSVTLAMSALAQEDLRIDQSRVYVSHPEACSLLEDKGMGAFDSLEFTMLSFPGGFYAMEFQCNFFDVKEREGSSHILASAICEFPGAIAPDIFAIAPYSETKIITVSARDFSDAALGLFSPSGEEPVMGARVYSRCDKVDAASLN